MSQSKTYVTIITNDDVDFKAIKRDIHDRKTLMYVLTIAKDLRAGCKIYFGQQRYELKSDIYNGYLVEVILKSHVCIYRCDGLERKVVNIKNLRDHFREVDRK